MTRSKKRPIRAKKSQEANAGDLLLKIAESAKALGTSGPADLSSRVDYYLYGDGRPGLSEEADAESEDDHKS